MYDEFKCKTKFEIVDLIIKSSQIQNILELTPKITVYEYREFLMLEHDYMIGLIGHNLFKKLLTDHLLNC